MTDKESMWSVTEITRAIRQLLENAIQPFWVEGEVSNLTVHRSGHVYFSIKDAKAQISCVYFSGAQAAREMKLQDGMAVEIFGSVSFFEPMGRSQVLVQQLRPKGMGDLQKKFEALKSKLHAEGLFDESNKILMPVFPQRIGLITSPDGAAVRDFLQVLNRRFPGLEVFLLPVPVQGKGSAQKIAAAIHSCNLMDLADVIVITRGGGSIEDLWAFNEEIVARAIAYSFIPIISGVGHEVDFTIADFCADLRAPTPSAAAELVIRSRRDFLDQVKTLDKRLSNQYNLAKYEAQRKLDLLRHRLQMLHPERRIQIDYQKLDLLQTRLRAAISKNFQLSVARLQQANYSLRLLQPKHELLKANERLVNLRRRLVHAHKHELSIKNEAYHHWLQGLELLNPQRTLERGYSIVTRVSGELIKSKNDVQLGEHLNLHLADGDILVKTELEEG